MGQGSDLLQYLVFDRLKCLWRGKNGRAPVRTLRHIVAFAGERPIQLDEVAGAGRARIDLHLFVSKLDAQHTQHALNQCDAGLVVRQVDRDKEMSTIARVGLQRDDVLFFKPRTTVGRPIQGFRMFGV